ncbi:P-loop containing nucleoside triphosphate hydrolase protein [Delitschia confertaspora ATCC 74209]|uniref:RNA helicase n=1 Tax=Delitschia confertaspora ATCC 74209 TaxID=1513339 RepID=A0A9P4MP81_9PLEO|nr:P-loop containing nucleoside triphosphate hydrolase protein [Delitschia confertaspora ATCC 74209]
MASRHADQSMSSRYNDPRGPRRDPPPRDFARRRDDRPDERRDPRRGDRREDLPPRDQLRDSRDRRNVPRDSGRDARYNDRRDGGRYRSRSPRRRSPSRDRMRNQRNRSPDRGRGNDRYRDYDRGRDYRGYRDDRGREGSRELQDERRRGSMSSATSGTAHHRGAKEQSRRATSPGLTEEQKKQKEQEEKQKAKLEKLAAWKAAQAEKKAREAAAEQAEGRAKLQATLFPESNGNAPSLPKSNIPSNNPSPSPTPVVSAKQEPSPSTDTVPTKSLRKPKVFKLDEGATANGFKAPTLPAKRTTVVKPVDTSAPKPLKPTGNVSSFGLKARIATEDSGTRNALLDDDEDVQTRKFEKLPDYDPEEHVGHDEEDDTALGDIGSDDEDAVAAQLAAAEKRRQAATSGDVEMTEAPVVEADVDTVMADQEEEVDPLDAYMSTLNAPAPTQPAFQSQTLFGDETDVNMEAVEGEDIYALANVAKKKKKEIIVVDHRKVDYMPFRKNFYIEPVDYKDMTPEELADLRLELDGIKVSRDDVPKPVTRWGQMGLTAGTLEVLRTLNYTNPTSIQAQAIPIAESGLDMMGLAKTGSGKTLAFGIPLIRHIIDQEPLAPRDGPISLIMAPTRELAQQIVRELKPFLKAHHLKAEAVYGGAPIKDQIGLIKKGGIHVLCATPGRLIDLLTSNSGRVLSFTRVTYVVLDEADRMFDMGFEPQVTKIMNNIRPDRQCVLFSATLPRTISALARKVMTDPVEVNIGGRSVVAPEITQIIEVLPAQDKERRLLFHLGELTQDENARALVFVEKQEDAETLLGILLTRGYPCNSIHGAKDMNDRQDAINDFKSGVLPVLIATSVAARGLDIPQLQMVVNYDCPTHLEDYVHRCGRTGRAGNKGTAITFIQDPEEEKYSFHIIKALKQSNQPIPPELKKMADSYNAKVAEGTAKRVNRNIGFTGKGLDKLDAERERDKLREKRLFKTGDEKDEEEEEDKAPVTSAIVKKDTPTPAAATPQQATPSGLPSLGAIVVKKTERPGPEGSNPAEAAKQAALAIGSRLGKKGQIYPGQPIDNKGPDAGAYHATVEINDFPQKARWAVTNRTNVAKILESTGTSITTKGNYYGPGKLPGEGELPKLYILVEGETEQAVSDAMHELHRLLREGTEAANDTNIRGPTGRYTVP